MFGIIANFCRGEGMVVLSQKGVAVLWIVNFHVGKSWVRGGVRWFAWLLRLLWLAQSTWWEEPGEKAALLELDCWPFGHWAGFFSLCEWHFFVNALILKPWADFFVKTITNLWGEKKVHANTNKTAAAPTNLQQYKNHGLVPYMVRL